MATGDRQTMERYGPGGFKIAGTIHTGPVLILPGETLDWQVTSFADLRPEDFQPLATRGGVEILLIGTGLKMLQLPKLLREAIRRLGIVADAMDTGAACRTYSVLLAEERRVAAALLPLR